MKTKILSLLALLSIAGSASARILINEIHKRTPATTNTMVDNNESDDQNVEFVELLGSPNEYLTSDGTASGKALSLIFIATDGSKNYGRVHDVWKLVKPAEAGQPEIPLRVGTNGLILLGNHYDLPGELPWQSFKSTATAVGDPVGCNDENLPDDDGLTAILVVDYKFPISNEPILAGQTSAEKPDFDIDDNGVFDWKQTPVPTHILSPKTLQFIDGYSTVQWTPYAVGVDYMDSIGYNASINSGATIRTTYATANLSNAGVSGITALSLQPFSISRYGPVGGVFDFTARSNSSLGWYGGILVGDLYATAYNSTLNSGRFNKPLTGSTPTWTGNATPGSPNFSTNPAPVTPVFRISEVNLNPPGTPGISYDATGQLNPNDGNFEYIEIANVSTAVDKSGSLAGYSLVIFNALGQVEEHWDLSKFATGSNGLLLLGDRYPDGYCPFAKIVDPATNFGDPSAPSYDSGAREVFTTMNQGDIGSNNGFTLVLVKSASNAYKYNRSGDKTTVLDIDSDDNGTIDDGTMTAAIGGTVTDFLCSAQLSLTGTLVANRGGYTLTNAMNLQVNSVYLNPDNFSRKMASATSFNITTASPAAWIFGKLGARNESAINFRTGYSSDTTVKGSATPGKVNINAALPSPTVGSLLINEVHINPGGSPDGTEYVELRSQNPLAPMPNTWLVVVSSTGPNMGRVNKVLDLRNQNTGGNRLAMFGDGIEENTSALPPLTSARTVRDDPQSFSATGVEFTDNGSNFTGDSLDNEGVAVFLVVNTTTPTTVGTDLDPENDGLFTKPWTTTLDAVSSGSALGDAVKAGNHTMAPALVHNISRYNGNLTPLSATAWFGGELAQGAIATTLNYGAITFGSFSGAASPGRQNPTAPTQDGSSVLLNEIHMNPPGADNNKEFIELISSNGGVLSLNGYSLLFVDNDGNDTGLIQKVLELDGLATGSNGLALIGAGYNTIQPWVGAAAPDAATAILAPEGLEDDEIGRFSDNHAFCILLVKNFIGRVGDDLDIGSAADHNAVDDHILDTPYPWQTLVDGVSVRSYIPAEPANGTTPAKAAYVAGWVFPGTAGVGIADTGVPSSQWTPDSAARLRGNSSTDSSAWYGGDIVGPAALSTEYDAAQHYPNNLLGLKLTPGTPNIAPISRTSDLDNDSVPYFMELALGMDPNVPDSQKLPQPGYGIVTGWTQAQPYFQITRPTVGPPNTNYSVEASFDLSIWDVPLALSAPAVNLGGGMEKQTWVIGSSYRVLLPINKRIFFRLRCSE